MQGVVTDFTHGLDLSHDLTSAPVTFFYPGSSIGNFSPTQAQEFLQDVRLHCASRAGSGLLIGVDTKKDTSRLEARTTTRWASPRRSIATCCDT